MMRKFSGIIALLIACAMLLCGCSTAFNEQNDRKNTYEKADLGYTQLDLVRGNEKNVSLYFLSEDKERIVAETRTIYFSPETDPAVKVVEELLKGPKDSSLNDLINGCRVDRVETLYNVVNVYIEEYSGNTDDRRFTLALAIANTMYDFLDKTYINVYINGKTISFEGKPVGLLTKNQGIIVDEIAKQQQKNITGTIPTVLYFLDDSERFLVPEVRNITYKNNEYASKIAEELIKGPEEMYYYKPSIDDTISVISGSYIKYDEVKNDNILIMNLTKSPVVYTESYMDGEMMAIASLVYSIMGIMPDIDGISFLVNGESYDDTVYVADDFKDYLGADIRLYFPNDDGNMLYGIDRKVKQYEADSPMTILTSLISGPGEKDGDDVWPAFPIGVNNLDIKDVYISDNMAVVDFAPSILEKLSSVSAEDEKIMIFSIVNSLTYLQGINSVLFLVDGERVEYLGGGINIVDPIMNNPGIITF